MSQIVSKFSPDVYCLIFRHAEFNSWAEGTYQFLKCAFLGAVASPRYAPFGPPGFYGRFQLWQPVGD